jgi:hypothetical protein
VFLGFSKRNDLGVVDEPRRSCPIAATDDLFVEHDNCSDGELVEGPRQNRLSFEADALRCD